MWEPRHLWEGVKINLKTWWLVVNFALIVKIIQYLQYEVKYREFSC